MSLLSISYTLFHWIFTAPVISHFTDEETEGHRSFAALCSLRSFYILTSSLPNFLTVRTIWRCLFKNQPSRPIPYKVWCNKSGEGPRIHKKHKDPNDSEGQASMSYIHRPNSLTKAVCFPDMLKHQDPWGIKPGHTPSSGSRYSTLAMQVPSRAVGSWGRQAFTEKHWGTRPCPGPGAFQEPSAPI